MTIGTNWPSFIQTEPPLAVSIRLTIAPEASTPVSGTPTSSSRHGRQSSIQFVAGGAIFEPKGLAVPDAASQFEEALGIEARGLLRIVHAASRCAVSRISAIMFGTP